MSGLILDPPFDLAARYSLSHCSVRAKNKIYIVGFGPVR